MADLPQIQLPDRMIHLGLGQPGNEILPLAQIQAAGQALFSRKDPAYLAYGATRGNPGFRDTLARFLTGHTPVSAVPDQIMATSGNSQALDLICTCFAKPGDTVLVEAPSYFLALRIFADHGLNLMPVPMDERGVKTDALEEILGTVSPAFFYTIPFFHNPTGITMSLERQEALAALAEQHDLMIVSDDVYWFLNFDHPPPPSLARFADRIPVLSLGSFSKILAPGLRLGWIQARPELIKKLTRTGLVQSGGGLNPFAAELVEEVIRSGMLADQINTYVRMYSERADFLYQALGEAFDRILPGQVRLGRPCGGYFIWLRFPESFDFLKLRKMIQAHDVDLYPGAYFDPASTAENPGPAFAACARLSFALCDREGLRSGVTRLEKALAEVTPGRGL